MKLEEEIKQKKFDSEFHKLAVNLLFTGNWMHQRISTDLKRYGLTLQQFNVLRILRGQHPEPVTVNLLIERMLDKMSNASRIVDKLVSKELAERKTCPVDRRAVDVKITQKGLTLLKKIAEIVPEWEKAMKTVSFQEAKTLNGLLDKLRGKDYSINKTNKEKEK